MAEITTEDLKAALAPLVPTLGHTLRNAFIDAALRFCLRLA